MPAIHEGPQRRASSSLPYRLLAVIAAVVMLGAIGLAGQPSAIGASAPSAPGNTRTSDLTCSSVTFAWDAATSDADIDGYDVYHDGQHIKTVDASTTSTELEVNEGASWGLYVNARDTDGNVSQASETVDIKVPNCEDDTEAPSAPSELKASAGGTMIELDWHESTDDVGVEAYRVYRDHKVVGTVTGSSGQVDGNPVGGPSTHFVDSGLKPSTSYEYAIKAVDAHDNVSRAGGFVKAKTGAKCTSSVCGVKEVKAYKDLPWGLANLPNGRVLTSQRDAHTIIRTNPKTGDTATVGKVPNVESTDGEGGLLGIAVDPDFEDNGLIYIMHTSPTDNRVVRMKIVDGKLDTSSSKVLLSGIDRNKFHNGGRIAFSPGGMLYVATGDGQVGSKAQDKDSLNGKILRMKPDGSVPTTNPYGNYVWTYGHRNPQGLAFDSQGRLWEQEFGNSIMDEVNLIKKGGHYGWEDCEGTEGDCDQDGFIAPKRTYPTSEGSCSGIEIVKDTLYTACLRGQRLMASKIDGTDLKEPEILFSGTFGRLRTVQKTPGGNLWLTTSNNGDKDSVPNNTDGRLYKVELNGK